MKQTGMLVVSLMGVNFEFWSRLGCSKSQYFALPGSRLGFHEEAQNYAKRNKSNFLLNFLFRADWSPLGVTKSWSHAQMVSFRGYIQNF